MYNTIVDKIESFKVNHLTLLPGLYLSRRDKKDGVTVSTFDLRLTAPNRFPPVDTPALHTIEHLGATFLRNSAAKSDIVYFGPMGCRTGFYLVMFGALNPSDIFPLVIELCDFILGFEGDIPGATARECGNYREQNLDTAKHYIAAYKDQLEKYKRTEYPE